MALIKRIIALLLLAAAGGSADDITFDHRFFADDLTDAMAINESPENECISALGVSMVFSLIYPGAVGKAAEEIRKVVRLDDDQSKLLWDETANQLDVANEGCCAHGTEPCSEAQIDRCSEVLPLLEIANSIWLDDGNALDSTYQDIAGHYLRQIDFSHIGAGDIVNEWVADNTRDLIDSIVKKGPIGALLLAINALYLKAPWKVPFEESRTNEDIFYSSPSRSSESVSMAHFLHAVRPDVEYTHKVIDRFSYQILRLPLTGSLSMVFVLPLSDGAPFVKSKDILEAIPMLESHSVAIALPKFKFESKYEVKLKKGLQNIGMRAPFAGGICLFAGGGCSFVDTVIQKTAIDLNEKGVEAAAVTVIILDRAGPPSVKNPIEFRADHPFQFIIHSSQEDLVLFSGKVTDPGIVDGSVAPLNAMHNDEDFWTEWFNVPQLLPPPEPKNVIAHLSGSPKVLSKTPTSVTLQIETDIPSEVKIVWSKGRKLRRWRRSSTPFVQTQADAEGNLATIQIDNLQPFTRYYYKIVIKDGKKSQNKKIRRFRTRKVTE